MIVLGAPHSAGKPKARVALFTPAEAAAILSVISRHPPFAGMLNGPGFTRVRSGSIATVLSVPARFNGPMFLRIHVVNREG